MDFFAKLISRAYINSALQSVVQADIIAVMIPSGSESHMKFGFIKAAAASVDVTVADTAFNTAQIVERIDKADALGVNLLVFPELCVTGYSCGDLFFSQTLQAAAEAAVGEICRHTAGKYPLVIVGAPLRRGSKLYNCAVAMSDGHILAVVPKTYLPNHEEFYEKRQFASGAETGGSITVGGESVPFGTDILLRHRSMPDYCVGLELCEDLWAPCPPSGGLCLAGATIIANPSASDELIGKADYRRLLVRSTSARFLCGYVYCNAGETESTQDVVFSRHHIIGENGSILAENAPFGADELTVSEIDVCRLSADRHKNTSFQPEGEELCRVVTFQQEMRKTHLTRTVGKNPFVPPEDAQIAQRAEAILAIQTAGLKKRLEHTRSKCAVVGISGGLDSCLALLVMVRAFDKMQRPRRDIVAVTMPCFGTTDRTRSNAEKLCAELGVTLKTVDITRAVKLHFEDIGHDINDHDVTYENAQARERTQVIMDIANQCGGLLVGTGDLSELALGWCTYNGDHMSMYGVNASVPKTLVRYIVRYEARRFGGELEKVLMDILDTPVSPELLPAKDDGSIAQRTEDLVGPYELHDFFLYYMLRFGFGPGKIYRLARCAFGEDYDGETIKKWLMAFTRRFFSQQFKRSCMPDGPKVGSVSLSPRGDWRMPSDASAAVWLREIEDL
jgi:NAD+ synthase (glutamine-hydrolysing)